MGIALHEGLNAMGLTSIPFESLVLELLGTIGLIFIVLEAALELDDPGQMPLIVKARPWRCCVAKFAIAAFLNMSVGIPGWVYPVDHERHHHPECGGLGRE